MRAFIFSLDAFVAFTLALIAIYSLIFFSSVPSAYYYLLTQGHYLSRDVLLSLSTTTCTDDYGTCKADASLLDNIVAQDNPDLRRELIRSTVGAMIPRQFGYIVEMSDSEGQSWSLLYDTADYTAAQDPHAKKSKKLAVATQVITFGYSGKIYKLQTSPYNYLSCRGDGIIGPGGTGPGGTDETVDFGTITCGTTNKTGGGGSAAGGQITGNTPPSQILGGDLVPSSDVKLVKLTVYI